MANRIACGRDYERRSSEAATWISIAMLGVGAACGSVPDGHDAGSRPPTPLDAAAIGCTSDAVCDDGDPCNGEETCGSNGECGAAGVLPSGGVACLLATDAAGVCRGGECVPPGCGDGELGEGEECDDGNTNSTDGCTTACAFTCHDDEECADGTVCNGEERCNPTTHRCRAGTPLECDDANVCTADICNPVRGCRHQLIDEDGDGYASTTLGECGDDCDDADREVHPDADEICDLEGIDHNCNGSVTDETPSVWYLDCDRDTYAPVGASFTMTCERPANTACPGGAIGVWTSRAPTGFEIDCDDTDATRHPRASEVIDDGIDQDCDGGELCYLDNDDDGYRSVLRRESVDLDCNDAYEAHEADEMDCCEIDRDVFPGQSAWFTVRNECNSFDYDCSGQAQQRYTEQSSSCSVGEWVSSIVPPCC